MAWGGRAHAVATTRASSGVRRTSPPDKGTGEPANYRPRRRTASPPGSVHGDRRLAGLALARGADDDAARRASVGSRVAAESIQADEDTGGVGAGYRPIRAEGAARRVADHPEERPDIRSPVRSAG